MRADSAIFSGMSQAILMYRASGALQGERLLQVCVGGSIVLHVLAMLYAPKVEPPVVPPTKFTATLRSAPAPKPAAPEPAPAPPEPVAPKVETPPPVVTPAPPIPVAKPTPEKALSKSVTPAPVTASTPAPATPAPAAPPAEAKSAAPASETKDSPKSAAAPVATGDADEKALIARYASQLAQVAGKYKRYPNDAMQNQWEGTALITLRIGVDGRIMGAPEITTSSGHEILDAEARTTINKAKPFVQIPPELKGKEFVVQVRVVFSLKT
jgi:periplasmic protein TonB